MCNLAGALAADTLAVLFRQPFYAAKNPGLLQQVQHLFRFSTEYLMRSGAIRLRGEPVGEPDRSVLCPCVITSSAGRQAKVKLPVVWLAFCLQSLLPWTTVPIKCYNATTEFSTVRPFPHLAGLAGMLCHLHWTDPANLAFTGLLRCGVLDDICK